MKYTIEFRKGNKLLHQDGSMVTVTEVLENGVRYVLDDLPRFPRWDDFRQSELEVIELTPEWLSKLGFTATDNGLKRNLPGQASVSLYFRDGEVIVVSADNNTTMFVGWGKKYLHQLQNLWVGLTNAELKLHIS